MGDFYLDRIRVLDAKIAAAQAAGDAAQHSALCHEAARAVSAIAVRTGGAIRASWEARAAHYERLAGGAGGEVGIVSKMTPCISPADAGEASDVGDRKSLGDLQLELDALVGLEPVKAEVRKLMDSVNVQQVRKAAGMRCPPFSYHCVFTGNPGTGKTTVARIVAGIYRELGILAKGHLVEADRASLVGEYQGHTAVKTNKLVDSALDGVLFIDEAYALVNDERDTFGREAVNTLLKRIEDDRHRLVVIMAGYTDEMSRFVATNPGFRSRFSRFIEFPDYSGEELSDIFARWMRDYDYTASDETMQAMRRSLCSMRSAADARTFGNARAARSAFEKTVERQAVRLSSEGRFDAADLREILPGDLVVGDTKEGAVE